MATKLRLSIDTPCSENWGQMQQQDQGRFCGSCQKTVHDFTIYSDVQLLAFFQQNKNNVCGRMKEEQLREYVLKPSSRFSVTTSLKATLISIAASFVTVAGNAQVKVPVQQQKSVNDTTLQHLTSHKTDSLIISGRVIDASSSAGLPGATVTLLNSEIKAATDIEGNFTIAIPADHPDPALQCRFLGYDARTIQLQNMQEQEDVKFNLYSENFYSNIEMQLYPAMVGGISISYTRSLWWRIKSFFTRNSY